MKSNRSMIIAAFLLAATPLILQGCGGANGHEFTGQWQNVKDPADLVTIAKEGDQFIVTTSRDEKVIPVYDKSQNLLRIQRGSFGELVISHRKQTDTLMGEGDEYQRVK